MNEAYALEIRKLGISVQLQNETIRILTENLAKMQIENDALKAQIASSATSTPPSSGGGKKSARP